MRATRSGRAERDWPLECRVVGFSPATFGTRPDESTTPAASFVPPMSSASTGATAAPGEPSPPTAGRVPTGACITYPLRPEVAAAVEECQRAGIRVKMITGDHALTAHAAAEAAGILHDDDLIVTGDELSSLDEAARRNRIRRAAIFARTSPEPVGLT